MLRNVRVYITFIDDHTRLCWVYLLTDKTEVRSVFLNFHSMIQTQFQTKIQILRTGNGTEYLNHSLSTYLEENGIIHQSSCVDTLSKTRLQNRKIDIFLKLLVLCCLHLTCPHNFGVTPRVFSSFETWCTSFTSCLWVHCVCPHRSDLSGTNLIPERLNVSFLATIPQKRATNAMTQFHRSYMLA